MKCLIRMAAGALALCSASLFAADIPRADPVSLGFSAARLQRLDDYMQKRITAGDFPGSVTMILRNGQIAYSSSLGRRTAGGEPMSEDTIFRIYSMSKPITSVVAMMLVEEGRLGLSHPVHTYLPEFKTMTVATGKTADGKIQTEPAKRAMTVHDLIRHTAGLTYGFFGTGPAREVLKDALASRGDLNNRDFAALLGGLPLEHHPGEVWEYSYATDILGAVIERIEGRSLGEVMKARVFDPLGMKDTRFSVSNAADHARIAEPNADDRMIGNVAMFDPRTAQQWESGGGGLLSTMHDYARFALMLMNGGELDGVRILSPDTVEFMTADHLGSIGPGKYYLPGSGYGFGLGFAVRNTVGVSPFMGNEGEYNWGGAGGTYYVADPKEKIIILQMLQSPKHRVPLREALRSLVYGAVTGRP